MDDRYIDSYIDDRHILLSVAFEDCDNSSSVQRLRGNSNVGASAGVAVCKCVFLQM